MILADLHVHSRFAMACSKNISLENMEQYARVKGIHLLGTGDFQHPVWRNELNTLEERDGILYSRTGFPRIWQTEVSLIYTQGGKGRRIHHLIYAPNSGVVNQITEFLASKGRLDYDGRPIFGFTSVELVETMRNISKDIEIVPAHAWTPWFSIFGSKSGFDSVEECFQDQAKHIHAIETGMSSDPAMNRRLSQLDGINLVSFSDAHSFWPWRLGREATAFEGDPQNFKYSQIIEAIRTGKGIIQTVETDPNYGKYHFDGHRKCSIRFSPKESSRVGGICPKCGDPLTIGVQFRIDQLADRAQGEEKLKEKYIKLIPLTEIVSFSYGVKQLASKKVWEIYNRLIRKFGDEYSVLLEAPIDQLKSETNERLAQIIGLSRENKLKILAGYDGTYGKIVLEDSQIYGDSDNSFENPLQRRLDMFKS